MRKPPSQAFIFFVQNNQKKNKKYPQNVKEALLLFERNDSSLSTS
jgi:hypothetical protein